MSSSPEYAQTAFAEAQGRKHKLESQLEIKRELYHNLKRREQMITDEERDEMRKIYEEIAKLESELKEAAADVERFTPIVS
ncbi:MAG TPA: hypothetical protein VFX17_02240 [Patescibacteria group bacterium]|nr:hypothetical protein [Patescibacteria group bacterium]